MGFECFFNFKKKISAGLVDGKSVSIDRIPLTEHKGVYVPNPDYYNCEPFP
jgi:hypothetical protein